MSLTLPVDATMLLVGGLFGIGVLVVSLRERLRVPGAILLLGLGMLLADDGLAVVSFDDPALAQTLGVVALVVILFDGGITTRIEDLRTGALPGLLLATLGVLVTTGVTALALVGLLGLAWDSALLLGAIVSSTDAAAVFELLRRTPVPRRVAAALEVESGANDPIAVLLTVGLLTSMQRPVGTEEWVVFATTQLVGGLVVGLIAGTAGAWLLRSVPLPAVGLYPVLTLAVAATTYGLATAAGSSGFLAVYVAGIVIGSRVPRHRRTIRNVVSSLGNMADVGLFLLLGLLVFPSDLPGVALPSLAVTAVLLLVARPLAVTICLGPLRYGWREIAVASWAGLRGAVPIVLATLPLTTGSEGADVIFDVVFFVVLVSVALQGVTVPALVRRLGLVTTSGPAWEEVAEVVSTGTVGVDLVETTITADMAVAGRALRDLEVPGGLRVTTVLRDGVVLVPSGDDRLLVGDRALVAVADREDPARLVLAWMAQDAGRLLASGEVDP